MNARGFGGRGKRRPAEGLSVRFMVPDTVLFCSWITPGCGESTTWHTWILAPPCFAAYFFASEVAMSARMGTRNDAQPDDHSLV
jgi:hypothetical protein